MMIRSTRSFDSVVIGGGTAGCAIASRLSEQPGHTVALIEAGPDYGPAAGGRWPSELTSSRFFPVSHDWGYAALAPQGPIGFKRGRVIAGSSAINAVGIAWGTREDYDRWEAMGNPGWGFDGLLPYLQRVERNQDSAGWFHGRDGELIVTQSKANSPYVEHLLRAYAAAGIPWLDDLNDPDAREGAGRTTRNATGGRRIHAAAAYLDPARERPSLTILDRTVVDRIQWKRGEVHQVRTRRDGREHWLQGGQIVLCAGALGTPAILQRSGIGPADRLGSLLREGAPLHDLPGVGEGMWDHPGVPVELVAADGVYHRLAEVFAGPEFVGETQVVAKAKSDPALPWFNLNVIQWHGIRPPNHPEHNLLRFPIFLMQPAAPGRIEITSPDPEAPPWIETGWGDPADVSALTRGVELVRRIARRPAVRRWFAAEKTPGAEYQGPQLEEWVRLNMRTYNHCCGTARLGPASDPLAVVDVAGRVHGFDNLYVADASLMPLIPRAAICLTVLAIAEKVVEGLREA